MKLSIGSIVLLLCIQACTAQSKKIVLVKPGVINNQLSPEWKDALVTRMDKEELDSMAGLNRALTSEEQAWFKLIQSKTTKWNAFRDSLGVPFGNPRLADTLYILLGGFGVDDAFTYGPRTVCLDLTAFQANYGMAGLAENSERVDRIFSHEFSHLLHKDWMRKHAFTPKTFKDSVLWECMYEGVGMYRSLGMKWFPKNGVIPDITKTALENLYPQFIQHIATIQSSDNLSEQQKKEIRAHLSRGPVDKKWGAFTVAIWLSLEANGDDRKLVDWINKGMDAIIPLSKKYIP